MYEDYWQLETKPFEPISDTKFFYPGEGQQAALHKLRYSIESRRPAVLLAGPAGIGKTLVVRTLREQLSERLGKYVQLTFPLMSSRDMLAYLADQLGAPPVDVPEHTVAESLWRLERVLSENHARGKLAVLVIEEAHLLEDAGLLEPLRLLMNLGAEGEPWFTLLLVGQIPVLSSMDRANDLDERLEMKVLLKPFSLEETASYIEHRLQAAGATRSPFSSDAIPTIHQLTGGNPRRINRLCDLALVVAFASGEPTIDAEQLHAVTAELLTTSVAA